MSESEIRRLRVELDAERRRVHWLRIVVFLAFVILTGAAAMLVDQPRYRTDHARAVIADLIETMRTHASPSEREQAIAIGVAHLSSFVAALRELEPRAPIEVEAKSSALRKLKEIVDAAR